MENIVKEQYKTSENLKLRNNLHSYNVNKTDWNDWCFNQMHFKEKARILELGCGTGDFWYKNKQNINSNWNITLSDFSKGMLDTAKEKLCEEYNNFNYKEIDAQDIPYEDGSFDVVIARHMLYLVPDIEKAICEIKRVLVKGGLLYVTTNSKEAMAELNELVEKFDPSMELHNNGMNPRFELENGQPLLEKLFSEVKVDILSGKIVTNCVEAIVSYKASTIRGRSVLVGEKKQEFTKYIEEYIKSNGSVSITTKACIFKAKK